MDLVDTGSASVTAADLFDDAVVSNRAADGRLRLRHLAPILEVAFFSLRRSTVQDGRRFPPFFDSFTGLQASSGRPSYLPNFL
jgi:hypothetical protein